MPKRPSDATGDVSSEMAGSPSGLSEEVVSTVSSNESQELAELRELTRSLMIAVQAMQNQNTRNAQFQEAVNDVRAVTRAMLVAPAAGARAAEYGVSPHPALVEQECDCSPCACVSERCCAFEIVMTHVRVLSMQIEPIDSNVDTMEVRMFASLNGIGAVIPNMFSVLTLHKLVNQLGVWTQINQSIGTVYVCKGKPKIFKISVDAVEVEEGLVEQATALRDEYGNGTGDITLDCCCGAAPITEFDIDFTGGGQGRGSIAVRFTAIKKC